MSRGQMCRHQMSAKNFLSPKTLTKLNFFLLQICISHQMSQIGGGVLLAKYFPSPKTLTKLKIFLLQICISHQISQMEGVPSAENFLSPKTLTKLKLFLIQICISQQISQPGGGSLKTKNFLRDLDPPANLPMGCRSGSHVTDRHILTILVAFARLKNTHHPHIREIVRQSNQR